MCPAVVCCYLNYLNWLLTRMFTRRQGTRRRWFEWWRWTGIEVLGVIAYDIMRPPPACVTPNQRLLEVLPVVLASEQRNIPVVNTLKENRLVGALARAEVLGIFSEVIAASRKVEP